MEKRLMDVVPALIANREPAILGKLGECALHDPPMPTQLLAAFLTLSCYPALDGAPSQSVFAFVVVVVVGFVGMPSFWGRFLGLPRGRLMGSMASMRSSKSIESWMFAAL
jgi:hypothetical protein